MSGLCTTIEVRIKRVHVRPSLLMAGKTNRIDPGLWRPMIMSFQIFYGLTTAQLDDSRLSEIDESAYLTPDVERARLSPVASNHKLAA